MGGTSNDVINGLPGSSGYGLTTYAKIFSFNPHHPPEPGTVTLHALQMRKLRSSTEVGVGVTSPGSTAPTKARR